jgi:NHL repeat/WD40-like Beta Propeller Repeat
MSLLARRSILAASACLSILSGVLAFGGAPALAARGHEFVGHFGEPCSSEPCGNGQLKEPSGVAVNEASGDAYVVDKGNNRVERFSSTGSYLGQFDGSGTFEVEGKVDTGTPAGGGGLPGEVPTGKFSEPSGIAIDNSTNPLDPSSGDVYVVDTHFHEVIDKFSATGEYLGQLTGTPEHGFGEIEGITTDIEGKLWVYTKNQLIDVFTSAIANEFASEVVSQAEGDPRPNIAVDTDGNIYVVHSAELKVARLNSSGEVQTEEVGGQSVTGVAVEPTTNDLYIVKPDGITRFDSKGTSIEQLGSEQLINGSAIAVNSAGGDLYVSDATTDVVDVYRLQFEGHPTAQGEGASDVSARTATLSAEVDPHGASAEYGFEYGTCASLSECPNSGYEITTPVGAVPGGSGFFEQEVSAELENLLPNDVYHFRAVLHNAFGTGYGVEETFTTQAVGGGTTLPDGRAWEMVSPPDKHGALIEAINERGLIQAAADGSAFTYFADAPTETKPQGFANDVQLLATREATGWSSQNIATPHNASTGPSTGQGLEYRFFSNDLTDAVVEPQGPFTRLVGEEAMPEASERTIYSRADSTCQATPSTCYSPLVTAANVAPGTAFGGNPEALRGSVEFVGATPDLSHVVFKSATALTGTAAEGAGSYLYEWSAGKLTPVSTLSQGEGGPVLAASLGDNDADARYAISNDGSRVIWATGGSGGHLYMRDTQTGETAQLDAVNGGSGGGNAYPRFQSASSDGSKVFFTDSQSLTGDSGEGRGEGIGDLYECEMVVEAGKLTCKLFDLTPLSAKGPALVQGRVLASSEDGSWVYFVANGALTSDAVHGNCAGEFPPLGSRCNLYVWHGGVTKLIAAVSGEDFPDWAMPLNELTARVSPDGHWLAFMSQRPLTGYDTDDAVTGQPDEEVYLYHAESSESGKLVCASCNPTGGRPVGVEYHDLSDQLVGGDRVWGDKTWIAANIPGWTPYSDGVARYQSRYLSDSGRLFFNSLDALSPQDVNGAEDVYEYEPIGVPRDSEYECSPDSAPFSARSEGCVGLISSGSSAEESAFLDADESGGDVFFLTSTKLLPQDFDSSLDVYDAHECTAGAPCFATSSVQPPPCATGDSCKPAPTPQPAIFGSPSSATFTGAGNPAPTIAPGVKSRAKPLTKSQKLRAALKACRKKTKRRRAACEKQAKQRYASTGKAGKTHKGAK